MLEMINSNVKYLVEICVIKVKIVKNLQSATTSLPVSEKKKQQSSPAPQQQSETLKTKVSVNQKQQQHVGPSQKIVIDVKTEAPQPQPSTVAKVRLLTFDIGKSQLKFIYSEKATKFCEIFTLLLTGTTKGQK